MVKNLNSARFILEKEIYFVKRILNIKINIVKTQGKINYLSSIAGMLFLCLNVARAGEIGRCSYTVAHQYKNLNGQMVVDTLYKGETFWELKGTLEPMGNNRAILRISGNRFKTHGAEPRNMTVKYKEIGRYRQTYLKSFSIIDKYKKVIKTGDDMDNLMEGPELNKATEEDTSIYRYFRIKFTKDELAYIDGKHAHLISAQLTYDKNKNDTTHYFVSNGACEVKYYTHDDNDTTSPNPNPDGSDAIIQPVEIRRYTINPQPKKVANQDSNSG